MKNLLILAPHPDDEVVGTGILIKKKSLIGCKIHILFLTNGVIEKSEMWPWARKNHSFLLQKRLNEMQRSLTFLNVKEYFLQNIPTRTLRNQIKATFNILKKLLEKWSVDSVFVPAYEGGHQDHDIANYIASKFKNIVNVYEFPEYNYHSGIIRSNQFINEEGENSINLLPFVNNENLLSEIIKKNKLKIAINKSEKVASAKSAITVDEA
tara:strand:- start:396 stop:1025 length:630 start_codon:yes stop_codon:yes gene_type:complete